MLTALLGRIIIILFGVLNPAYRTYKAIKRRDYQEVVVLGMYWVVFSLFTTLELVTDTFFNWFPFYYELKIAFVIWLVTPASSGSSLIYRRFIHPELSKRENEIDEAINKATEKGYTKVVEFGAKGLNYAAKTVLNTALMGQDFLVEQLRRRSASLTDLPSAGRVHPSQRRLSSRMGAGDQRENTQRMFDSDPHCRNNGPPHSSIPEDGDPFALGWLQPGPTGSIGRQWKPPAFASLSEVPEDGDGGTTNTQKRPSVAQNSTGRGSSNRRGNSQSRSTRSRVANEL